MFLIRKTPLIVFTAIMISAVAGTAAAAFHLLMASQGMAPMDIKLAAENILFTGILISAAAGTFFTVLLSGSRNINRALDRQIRRADANPLSEGLGFAKLGKTGEKMNALYRQLAEITKKQEQKISAQSSLIRIMADDLSHPVIITDIAGQVLYASEKSGISPGSAVIELDKNIDVDILVQEFRPGVGMLKTGTKNRYRCVPVYSRSRALSYLVFTHGSAKLNISF